MNLYPPLLTIGMVSDPYPIRILAGTSLEYTPSYVVTPLSDPTTIVRHVEQGDVVFVSPHHTPYMPS